MKYHFPQLAKTLAAIALIAPGLIASTSAQAQNAGAAYDAFNTAFLVNANGQTYYATNLTSISTKQDGEWTEALAITVAEDRYQFTHAQGDRNLVIALLNSLAYYNAPNGPNNNWQTDGWDDNLAWMVNPFLRGYQLTGNSTFLTQAEAGWNQGYKQGWDTTVAGGGIWENTYQQSKCALSNSPFVFEGVGLYQATGDATYLSKAETIYAWMHSNLLVTSGQNAGQVHGCVGTNGAVQDPSTNDDDAFNDGAFLKAATELYRITGNQTYHNDALLVANHTVSKNTGTVANPSYILHNSDQDGGSQWAYWFTRGLSDFATVAELWPQYEPWLQSNANAAWNNRSGLNLTWNDWMTQSNDSNANPVEMSSAAAIWQHLLPASVNLTGTYEIQNVASGLAVSVSKASTTNAAPIVQEPFTAGSRSALWTFVPTSGGYYQIKNVNSGKVINVRGASGINGAGIVQWPAQRVIPGNDQWLPVQNPDGTYSFYNLNSLQALDDPSESTTSGTQLDQWFGNSTPAQKFTLIPQS